MDLQPWAFGSEPSCEHVAVVGVAFVVVLNIAVVVHIAWHIVVGQFVLGHVMHF